MCWRKDDNQTAGIVPGFRIGHRWYQQPDNDAVDWLVQHGRIIHGSRAVLASVFFEVELTDEEDLVWFKLRWL